MLIILSSHINPAMFERMTVTGIDYVFSFQNEISHHSLKFPGRFFLQFSLEYLPPHPPIANKDTKLKTQQISIKTLTV